MGIHNEFIRRLKKEGNWDVARGWIRNAQKRIKRDAKNGMTEREATAQAYEQALLKYPEPGADLSEEDIVHIAATKGSMDVSRDVEWAYNNLNDKRVRADRAPSAGAWNMLMYGRQARHKFIELVAKYDSQQQKEQEKEADAYGKDAEIDVKALRKLRAITEKVHREAIRDAIRQAPEVVIAEMRTAGYLVVEPENVPPSLNTPQTADPAATGAP